MAHSTPFGRRLFRLGALVFWLFRAVWRIRRLPAGNREARQQAVRQLSMHCLDILNVRLHGLKQPAPLQGTLIVANHVSWLDILVINSLYPSGFIAMKELKNWWVIGKMVANAGTIFIDRSNRKDIDPINQAIAESLRQGDNVCFFPEAKTSSGTGILPLKAALFQSAIMAGAPVQALALRYYVAQRRSESVSFADVGLFCSVWQIVSQPQIDVQVDAAPAIAPTTYDDRFVMKDEVEHYLRQVVEQDVPPALGYQA